MSDVSASTRPFATERWRSAAGIILILVAAGMIFAAGVHKLTVAYSPDLALYEHYAMQRWDHHCSIPCPESTLRLLSLCFWHRWLFPSPMLLVSGC